jgi:hypothetical protein
VYVNREENLANAVPIRKLHIQKCAESSKIKTQYNFKKTSLIILLNKNSVFGKRIMVLYSENHAASKDIKSY